MSAGGTGAGPRTVPRRAVVLGDIGRAHNYHLGDEAMTEVAIAQLTARGVDEITLAAVEPETARSFYGIPSVAQHGFAWDWPRERLEAELSRLSDDLRAGTAASPLVEAVRSADFALIAGGGNLTSEYPSHVFERAAFARIARHVGTPLLVTSQTVGPMLRPRERELVQEIVNDAVVFGAREPKTYELVRGLAEQPERVVQTLDDGILLEAEGTARAVLDGLGIGDRLVAASFTVDRGATGWPRAEYVARVADLLSELAARLDADVVLVPHTGSFERTNVRKDHAIGLEIADAASERVRALPVITARQYLAVLESSMLSVSSRYHATVFASAMGVPAVGVSMSYYSSVRMGGALGAHGLERFVVPAESWEQVLPACMEAAEGGGVVVDPERRASALSAQHEWWDALVVSGATGEWSPERTPRGLPAPSGTITPRGAWGIAVEAATPVFEDLVRERVLARWDREDGAEALRRVKASLRRERARAESAEAALTALEGELASMRNRRAVRLADAVGDVVRRVRRRG